MIKKKVQNNYIDNKKFYQALVEYKKLCDEYKEQGKEGRPKVPEYIGQCFFYIAERFSTKKNFRNYYYKDEMVSEGVLNCVKYVDRFDTEKYTNPFAYFTQIIFNSFIYRINKEKDYLYTKFKVLDKYELFDNMTDKQDGDDSAFGEDVFYSQEAFNKRLEFVSDFETKHEEKKQRATTKAAEKKSALEG